VGIVKKMKRGVKEFTGSIRRSKLGLGVFMEEAEAWYLRNELAFWAKKKLSDRFVSDYDELFRNGKWLIQRNCKKALASRLVESLLLEQREQLDKRREWNKWRETETLLDYFTSFKYSYSSQIPSTCNGGSGVKLVYSAQGKGRVTGVIRSHSIWLDAVDAPKELFRYRLRIQDCINWAYKKKLVPIMVTLTTYHQWHDLKNLLKILSGAWTDFTHNGKRRKVFDEFVKGWVRRLEITINDGAEEVTSNRGWHPHYHAILLIPREKLQELSDAEQEWRDAWAKAICKQFEKVEGEVISEGYVNALRKFGLVFSRCDDGSLRPVKDSKYLAKLMGYDSLNVYGGDTEITTDKLKDSKTPFDLMMKPELTAGDIDLFCEYALATKGIPAIKFSKGLEKQVKEYLVEHPEQSANAPCPTETIIATISHDVYQILYRNFKLTELREKIAEGYDALCDWFRQTFIELGCPELCEVPFAMPRPPT
jgi:hypothetical protein